jgi:hypothetical protein
VKFKPGDAVVHKSDKRPRQMVVVVAGTNRPPGEQGVETGEPFAAGYFCTWISGYRKCGAYFTEAELELQ